MLFFAGILVVSSANLMMEKEEDHGDSSQLENNTVLKIAKWMCDSTDYYDGEKFFTMVRGIEPPYIFSRLYVLTAFDGFEHQTRPSRQSSYGPYPSNRVYSMKLKETVDINVGMGPSRRLRVSRLITIAGQIIASKYCVCPTGTSGRFQFSRLRCALAL